MLEMKESIDCKTEEQQLKLEKLGDLMKMKMKNLFEYAKKREGAYLWRSQKNPRVLKWSYQISQLKLWS